MNRRGGILSQPDAPLHSTPFNLGFDVGADGGTDATETVGLRPPSEAGSESAMKDGAMRSRRRRADQISVISYTVNPVDAGNWRRMAIGAVASLLFDISAGPSRSFSPD